MDDARCYGRLAVVSDVDDEGVCPECRWQKDARTGLCRSPYNGAVLVDDRRKDTQGENDR
jgi:hypothetical protein